MSNALACGAEQFRSVLPLLFTPPSFADLIGESKVIIFVDSQGYVRLWLTDCFAIARE
jgi:hypothetical protein